MSLTMFWVLLLVGMLGSSTTAAILTWLLTKGQQRMDITIKLTQEYLTTYYENHAMANDVISRGAYTEAWTPEEETIVSQCGDWFEVAAVLYNTRNVDLKTIERLQLNRIISDFYQSILEFKNRLDHIDERWPEMRSLSQSYVRDGGWTRRIKA